MALALSRKEAGLRALSNIISELDRATILPLHEDIGVALLYAIHSDKNEYGKIFRTL